VAVVGNLYELESSVLDGDGDRGRAGVEAVLDELLDRRRRALDHLPRRDAVHHRFLQPTDAGRVPADARRGVIDVHGRRGGTEAEKMGVGLSFGFGVRAYYAVGWSFAKGNCSRKKKWGGL